MADLTTLDAVMTNLDIDAGDAAMDSMVATLVTSESARFVSMSGNPIVATNYVETRNGDNTKVFVPNYFPVISVSSVVVDGNTIPPRPSIGADGWVLVNGRVELVGFLFAGSQVNALPGFQYLSGVGNVVVSYRAGYEMIPEDVARAVCEMVTLKMRSRTHVGLGSQSIQGESVGFSQGPSVWAEVMSVVNAYRKQGC